MSGLPEKEDDNVLRWDGGKKGWYEVYYLKWNDRQSSTAYWIRYTVTSPLPGTADPYCELWAIFFDAEEPKKNFALKDRFPVDRLSWDTDRFRISVGDAELSMNKCRGAIADKQGNAIEWEVAFDSAGDTFRHFPAERYYTAAFPKTKVLAPHEDARMSGRVAANGRTIEFDDCPGQQTHIWGTKHALRWAWGHCNAFKEDPSAVFEGLDSQVKLGPAPSPHANLFYLRYKGRDYYMNSVRALLKNRSRWSLGEWSFKAKTSGISVKGRIRCADEDMVGVTYTDPDGEKLWCNNSKVADAELEVSIGSGVERLTCKAMCAAEFVDRRTYPQVPIRI